MEADHLSTLEHFQLRRPGFGLPHDQDVGVLTRDGLHRCGAHKRPIHLHLPA